MLIQIDGNNDRMNHTLSASEPKLISVREQPEFAAAAIAYFQQSWPEIMPEMYADAIGYSITAPQALSQWYVLLGQDEIVGCAGLISNDFISRMDLYPWLCALHVSESKRGCGYARLLIERCQHDAARAGFDTLYLCTDSEGLYGRYGFGYLAEGWHPWGETSRIYQCPLQTIQP